MVPSYSSDDGRRYNVCAEFACAFQFYRGPYGRHIAILIHVGQGIFFLGVTLVTLGYTALKELPEIAVQRVVGLVCLQLGCSFMLGGLGTYIKAQHTKVGGVSPLWCKNTIIKLYSLAGFLHVLFAFVISMIGFNIHEDWSVPFKISGPIGLMCGFLMVLIPRIYARTPCYKDIPQTSSLMGQHCSCGQRAVAVIGNNSSVMPSNASRDSSSLQQPVVLFSSNGNDLQHAFVHHSVVLPPTYESITSRVESPPGYVMVSPMSPPPTYDEAIGSPKEEDPEARPNMISTGVLHGAYLPSYDVAIANPASSAYPD